MVRGTEESLRRDGLNGERHSLSDSRSQRGSDAERNPPLRPYSFDAAFSGLEKKISYNIHEVTEATGVPLKTVRREAKDGLLVGVHFNSKIQVYLREDVLDWLWRRRGVPVSAETRAILKKQQTRRPARRVALPPETEESARRRAKYENFKRRLGRA